MGRAVPDGNLERVYIADMSLVLAVLAVLAWGCSQEGSAALMDCIWHMGLELVDWEMEEEETRKMLVALAMVDRKMRPV